MIKRFLILSIYLLAFLGAKANLVNAICVYTSSDEKVYFVFTDLPTVEFVNSSVVVKTSKENKIFQFEHLKRITFEEYDVETNINNASASIPTFCIENHTLNIYHNFYGDIYIYNIDGLFVGKYSSDDNGFCKIIIENNGVYIVRNKKFNFKVIL